jgi:WD40 repeat protein
MRTNFLLHVILIACLVTGCTASGTPTPGTGNQPTPNPYEPTPTDALVPATGSHNYGGFGVAWSPSGKLIAIPTGNGVFIYDSNTLALVRVMKKEKAFRYAAFGLTDNLLVMVDSNLIVTLWDLDADNLVEIRDSTQIDQIQHLCPDGKVEVYPEHLQLVCLDDHGVAALEQIRKTILDGQKIFHKEWVSADGSFWGIAYNNGHVEADIYNIAGGAKVGTYKTPEAVVPSTMPDFSLALSKDGQLVAIGDFAYNVTVWNTSTQKKVFDCKTFFPVKNMSFSPDNHKLALVDEQDHAVMDLTGLGCTIFPDKKSS